MREFHFKTEPDSLTLELSDDLRYAILLAQEKGASSWLTSLPILEHGHALHKGAFRHALALRYGCLPSVSHQNMYMARIVLLNMLSCVPEGGSQPYATMRFMI